MRKHSRENRSQDESHKKQFLIVYSKYNWKLYHFIFHKFRFNEY